MGSCSGKSGKSGEIEDRSIIIDTPEYCIIVYTLCVVNMYYCV